MVKLSPGGIEKFVSAIEGKQRLSVEECRERLIDAGMASLAEHGMSIGLDAVSLEHAIVEAKVPRSSAYAALSPNSQSSSQEVLQRQVLMRVVDARKETIDALMSMIAEFMADQPEGLSGRELYRELIRVAGSFNLNSVMESRPWQIVFAMRSIINTVPDVRDQDLLDWMAEGERELRNATIDTLYRPMAELFGLRPRSVYGEDAWHLLEIAQSSLAEGLSMRGSLEASQYFHGLTHFDNPDDDSDWSIFALLFDRFAMKFFEFIPTDN